MSRGEINVDPIEGEFFTTEALGSLSDALIREAIQNSLDAGITSHQVRIIISFCNSGHLDQSRKNHYIGELDRHLTTKNSGIPEPPLPDEPLDFLVLEDFETRGLVGNIRENEDSEVGSGKAKNDFFYFWRNIGRAVEGSTARGRWGLGKTVFQAASRINSFFGLTIRHDDSRKLLMGQSVLKIHHIDNKKFAPYGYFGIFDDENLALPFWGEEYINNFCRDFFVQRQAEAGLSVVIPFPEKDIQPNEIIRSAIHHYFFPILSGDLVVIVKNGNKEDALEADSIFKYLDGTDWPDKEAISRRLEFAKWCIDVPGDKFVKMHETETGKAPKWDDKLFESNNLEDLRKMFDLDQRIAIRVPHWIHKIGNDVEKTFFDVFAERDPFAKRGEDHFIREGVTIAGVSSIRQSGIRVIVSVKDKPLSKFLGDSENPAHTEWQERSLKFKNKYKLGPGCLRFVKNSPREIIKILTRPAKGRDETLLKDFFYIDIPPEPDQPDITEEPVFFLTLF